MFILLTGKKRAGKNTAAEYIEWNHDYTQLALADKVKEAALKYNPYIKYKSGIFKRTKYTPLAELVDKYGWEEAKDTFPEIRRWLQTVGTENGRDLFGKSCWFNLLVSMLPKGKYAVSDVRFDDEIINFKNYDKTCVIQVVGKETKEVDNHSSETGVSDDLVDWIVYNTGTKAQLYEQLDYIITNDDDLKTG